MEEIVENFFKIYTPSGYTSMVIMYYLITI